MTEPQEVKEVHSTTTNEDLLQAITNPGSAVKLLGQQAPTVTVFVLAFFILYNQVQGLVAKVELLGKDTWTQDQQHTWEKESLTPLLTEIREANKEQANTMKSVEIRLIRIEDRQQRTR